jgi:hypothetical protein
MEVDLIIIACELEPDRLIVVIEIEKRLQRWPWLESRS